MKNIISNTPILSIVIPVYNTMKYLDECIESVLKIDSDKIEIICVNDGSNDGSDDILKKYEKLDNRIKIKNHDKNLGPSEARNTGITYAKGKYIYFLDSDDVLISHQIMKSVEYMEMKRLEVLAMDTIVISESTTANLKDYSYTRRYDYSLIRNGIDFFSKAVDGDWISYVAINLYRLDFLINNNLSFPIGILHEDELFISEVLLANPIIDYINIPIYKRRVRDNSIMTSELGVDNLYGYYFTFTKMYHYLYKENLDILLREKINIRIDSLLITFESRLKQMKLSTYMEGIKKYKELPEHMEFVLLCECIYNKKLKFIRGLEDKLVDGEQIYLYGAGEYALYIMNNLKNACAVVCGIVVTELRKSGIELSGIEIKGIEEIPSSQRNIKLVIATSSKYQHEMSENAKRLGFGNVILCTDSF